VKAGALAGAMVRSTVSGTMRARQTKKERASVTATQWLAYIAVAAATTWLTRKLDDVIEQRLGR
jgi:hypothetical protein